MTRLKKAIGYTVISTFVLSLGVGILGSIGVLAIQQAALPFIFGIALAESVGGVIAMIKAEHYFSDPPVERTLREELSQAKIEHAEEISKLRREYAEEIARLKREHAQTVDEIHRDYRKRMPPSGGPLS